MWILEPRPVNNRFNNKRATNIRSAGTKQTHNLNFIPSVEDGHLDGIEDNQHADYRENNYRYYPYFPKHVSSVRYPVDRLLFLSAVAGGGRFVIY